jgi:hypothetical protein
METMLLFLKRFFYTDSTRKERRTMRLVIIPALLCITALFAAGYTVVYARSFDMMNDTPLVVWKVEKEGDETAVTCLGKTYRF